MRSIPKPIRPVRDSLVSSVNKWQGLAAPTGSTYSSAAQTLSKLRGEYYTGEAMKKLDEEGSKLDDVHHSYKAKKDGREVDAYFNYSQMKKAWNQVQNGTYTGKIGDFEIDASKIGEYYRAAQKEGAMDYIRASMGLLKDDYGNVVKGIENTTMTEMAKQLPGILEGLGVDASTKSYLKDLYREDPGRFFKKLSDISKQLETTGSRRSAFEQNQEKK